MNLFDRLTEEALHSKPELSSLRMVVEKELLHHDILKALSKNNLLKDLTFIGGTALRLCYGGVRLSEDLEFTGGGHFSRESLSKMGQILSMQLNKKYGLKVKVSEPEKETGNVSTWKITVETRPEQKNFPAQRVNIDICALPSYERRPMMLLNPYNVDMGTNGLIVQTQSQEEIYVDKLIAFALRPNRIKYRDLWDIVWLYQKGIKPNFELIKNKLNDRKVSQEMFCQLFQDRIGLMEQEGNIEADFHNEMKRFLPAIDSRKLFEQEGYWTFLIWLMTDLKSNINKILNKT